MAFLTRYLRASASAIRRGSFEIIAIALSAVLVLLQGLGVHYASMRDGLPEDPDSDMRIALLGWSLNHGRGIWMDHLTPILNAPYGASFHWTLPYDATVVGAAWLWAHLHGVAIVDWKCAIIQSAPALNTVIALLLTSGMVFWCRAAGLGRYAVLACALMVASPALETYSAPQFVSHHQFMYMLLVWQMVFSFSFWRRPSAGTAVLASLSVILSTWETMEALPVAGLSGLMFLLAALRGECVREAISRADLRVRVLPFGVLAAVLCSVPLGIQFLDPSTHGVWALDPDRFSLVNVRLFATLGACALEIALLRLVTSRAWSLGATAVWVVPVIVVVGKQYVERLKLLFPDALANRLYWTHVGELMPVFTNHATMMSDMALQVPVLCGLAWFIMVQARELRRKNGLAEQRDAYWVWLSLAGFLVVADVMAFQHCRSACVSAIFSAFAGVVVVSQILRQVQERWPGISWKVHCALPIMALLYLCAAIAGQTRINQKYLASQMVALSHTKVGQHPIADRNCRFGPLAAGQITAHLPPGSIILTDEVSGSGSTDLLMRTNMFALPGGYHRNQQGVADSVRSYYTPDWSYMEHVVRARHVAAVSFCRSMETLKPKASIYGDVAAGNIPRWLIKANFGNSTDEELFVVNWSALRG